MEKSIILRLSIHSIQYKSRRLRNYTQPCIERESLFSAVIFIIITHEDKIFSILFK